MTQSGGWGVVRDPKEGRGGAAAVVVCNGVGGKHGGGGGVGTYLSSWEYSSSVGCTKAQNMSEP